MAPPRLRFWTSNCSLLLIYQPRKDERLNWPSWLTYSGRFTHISGHPSAADRAQDRESSSVKDQHSKLYHTILPSTFLSSDLFSRHPWKSSSSVISHCSACLVTLSSHFQGTVQAWTQDMVVWCVGGVSEIFLLKTRYINSLFDWLIDHHRQIGLL